MNLCFQHFILSTNYWYVIMFAAHDSVVGSGTYATSRKVAGSAPDEVIFFFNLPNPSSLTMALGSTGPLTETFTRNLHGAYRAAGAQD
jgi:hypothetical protein